MRGGGQIALIVSESERVMLSNKERGTIIFALEEYAKVLESENSYEAKNSVLELIWKLDTPKGGE